MALPKLFANSIQKARAFWCLLFVCFIFCYLAFFQREVLRLTLDEYIPYLSWLGPVPSAALIALLLLLLQVWHTRRYSFSHYLYVLSSVPGFAVAAALTSLSPSPRIVTLVACAVLVAGWYWAAERMLFLCMPYTRSCFMLRTFASNAAIFLALQLLTVLSAHHDAQLHYELRALQATTEGRYEDVLRVGERSDSVSPTLFALRVHAASHLEGGIGQYLFKYPVPSGGSQLLLPTGSDYTATVCRLMIYLRLACIPQQGESISAYMERAASQNRESEVSEENEAGSDYFLAACLLDKQLDKFARAYKSFRPDAGSVQPPRFDAEALLLYSRLRTEPVIVYRNNAIRANYADFSAMEKKNAAAPRTVRSSILRDSYGETYWWYYFYK